MARVLKDLLANDHPLFLMNIARFERASGNAGIDVRLIGEITDSVNRILRELGLDPADTTGTELYLTLNALVKRDEPRAREILSSASYMLGNLGTGPISFNFVDVVENAHHDLPYEKRTVAHAQRCLRAELVKRYAEHERTHDDMVHMLAKEVGLLLDGDADIQDEIKKEEITMTTPRILAIGDIITDAFIKLSEDYAEVTTDDKGYQRLSFELGAKIPYDSVEIVEAVECSPNAAVSMTRLGLDVGLMTWVGDDEPGQGMIKYLETQGVGTDDVVVEPGMKSNYHYVLRYGSDRTKLQRFEDYSYQWHAPAQTPDWLYLGVLGEKTWPLHESILQYLSDNPSIKLVFQPGMYHFMWGAEKMAEFYRRAEIVIMNREEAAEVTGKDRGDVHALLNALHDLGVTVAVVTDGPDGAYASDGTKRRFMRNYPDPAPPLDRTGAGDAFASTLAAALALGESLDTALEWAPINSMSVVQKMGAQTGLLTREQLQRYLDTAPEGYVAEEMK